MAQTSRPIRDYVWEEVIGRLPDAHAPANPRTRLIYDEPKFRGYEVMLDVWPGVFAYGILLVPKDIRPGERRPVVVCQHGLEGRPPMWPTRRSTRTTIIVSPCGWPKKASSPIAPQNPYIGEDRFRLIQRKGHPLKLSLFSFILGQHQRTLEWLARPAVCRSRADRILRPLVRRQRRRCASRPCLMDTRSPSARPTSTSGSGRPPASTRVQLHADAASTTCSSSISPTSSTTRTWRIYGAAAVHGGARSRRRRGARRMGGLRIRQGRAGSTQDGDPNRTEIEFFNGPHTIHGVGHVCVSATALTLPGVATAARERCVLDEDSAADEVSASSGIRNVMTSPMAKVVIHKIIIESAGSGCWSAPESAPVWKTGPHDVQAAAPVEQCRVELLCLSNPPRCAQY